MRREYDFSGGERGKFYGKISAVRVAKDKPAAKKKGSRPEKNDLAEINELFRRLWNKAEGQEGYRKSEWTKLGKLLNRIAPPSESTR